ncbi:MAG: hypothetical protein D6679_12915 [Candidatus Hydrogenedentota bacterium]|nr:MAG: hypothetical protein D6679_12915 [Candidatus Hydrogenedentota bacterium]
METRSIFTSGERIADWTKKAKSVLETKGCKSSDDGAREGMETGTGTQCGQECFLLNRGNRRSARAGFRVPWKLGERIMPHRGEEVGNGFL